MTASPEQVEQLLERTARLRAGSAAMPWAEPPPQPTGFDLRDAQEADEFDQIMAARRAPSASRCQACGYRTDARGHARNCAPASLGRNEIRR